MKILVLGSQGQLGRCLQDQLKNSGHQVVLASRRKVDVAEYDETKNFIEDQLPDVIVNATAYTNVDKAETDIENAKIVNHLAVKNLATICKKIECWLLHLSTDYVFDGYSNIAYKEDDKTNPQSVYGETKLMGELAIKSSNCKYLIIRTAWVYSEYGNNFLKTMLNLASRKNKLNIVGDQIGCPTYGQDLAKAIVCVIDKMKPQNINSGLYHYAGNLSCTWVDFSEIIFKLALELKIINAKPNVASITTEDFPTAAKRPPQSQLNSNKFKNTFGISPSDCTNGIRSSLEAIKKGIDTN